MGNNKAGLRLHRPSRWVLTCSFLVAGVLGSVVVQAGSGDAASMPAAVASTAVTKPGPPTRVAVIPRDEGVAVSWAAPVNDGGSPITDHYVESSPGSKGCLAAGDTCTVHGLSNGVIYKITVRDENVKGWGPPSAPVSVKPGVPLSPSVAATAGNKEVSVGWSAPQDNGSAISRYNVISIPGAKSCTTKTARSCTISGLINGSSYRFEVTATNAWGTGSAGISASVTPPIVQIVQIDQFNPGPIDSDGTNVWVVDTQEGDVGALTQLSALDGSVGGTNDIGSGPDSISSDGTHVWVSNLYDNTVSEFDCSDGSLVQTIPVGNGPDGVSSDGTHVWVANLGDNTVTELNASDGSLVRTIPVGNNPDAVSSDGTNVWVANSGDNTVTEINASGGSVTQTIPVGAGPIAISSDGVHVWVANNNYSTSSSITELTASNGSLVQTIADEGGPTAISSDGAGVWISNGNSSVTELSASSGALVQTIPLAVEGTPDGITSDGRHVWVSEYAANVVFELDT